MSKNQLFSYHMYFFTCWSQLPILVNVISFCFYRFLFFTNPARKSCKSKVKPPPKVSNLWTTQSCTRTSCQQHLPESCTLHNYHFHHRTPNRSPQTWCKIWRAGVFRHRMWPSKSPIVPKRTTQDIPVCKNILETPVLTSHACWVLR